MRRRVSGAVGGTDAEAITARVGSNPKHRGVVDLDDRDIETVAVFVRQLARRR